MGPVPWAIDVLCIPLQTVHSIGSPLPLPLPEPLPSPFTFPTVDPPLPGTGATPTFPFPLPFPNSPLPWVSPCPWMALLLVVSDLGWIAPPGAQGAPFHWSFSGLGHTVLHPWGHLWAIAPFLCHPWGYQDPLDWKRTTFSLASTGFLGHPSNPETWSASTGCGFAAVGIYLLEAGTLTSDVGSLGVANSPALPPLGPIPPNLPSMGEWFP